VGLEDVLMPVIRAPKTDHKQEPESQQIEDHRREHAQQFDGDDLRGNVLELEFDPSLDPPKPLAQAVVHRLGQVPNGWEIQSLRPKAGVAVIIEVSGTDDSRLALFATAPCFARIKVF
jgi:hypothetical protein